MVRRILLVMGAGLLFLTVAAAPAQAHDVVNKTSGGCLLNLHWNLVGGLDSTSGTCNAPGDNYWRGTVKDNHATSDGYCVFAELDSIVMASSCNSSGSSFTFLDPQRDKNAFTWICRSDEGYCRGTGNVGF